MLVTAVKGNMRFPADVLTINCETRVRSSWGVSATSRTRPLAAPEASYTVAPNSSQSDTVAILKENTQERERMLDECGALGENRQPNRRSGHYATKTSNG